MQIREQLLELSSKSTEQIEAEANAAGDRLAKEVADKKLAAKKKSYNSLQEEKENVFSILQKDDSYEKSSLTKFLMQTHLRSKSHQ